ncbi:tyrosine-type recombinase/integrase [Aerococcaceae bacterium zg-B36]|uniref:tyrosine-type recombinase/integrase n=1 Tax=Aerococcaceae bacterium zg-252 TaxID=2796928 RepID=UPI001BD8EA05|nr:tyrosine-type recombinase/integrase [Aerococcaceae bacterium zg-B36]
MARKVVRFTTKERMDNVNKDSIKVYEKYLRSNIIKNKDVKDTTYKVYKSNFNIFLCYLYEYWDNIYILSDEFKEEAVEILESFILFCQDDLGNGKKNINTKLSSISTFYHWCVKRDLIESHPFDSKLTRMQNAREEKLISEHYLTKEQVETINQELLKVFEEEYNGSYDYIDAMIWFIGYDSAARIGALSNLKLSDLVVDENNIYFDSVREKRGKIVPIPIEKDTYELIRKYVKYREDNNINIDDLIISYMDGHYKKMTKQAITNRVKKIGRIIGIDDFRPHSIRKTRLNHVAEIDIRLAKTLANHEDISTTEKFYTKQKDAKDVFAQLKQLQNN